MKRDNGPSPCAMCRRQLICLFEVPGRRGGVLRCCSWRCADAAWVNP